MNQTLVGVLGTLLTLGGIGVMAGNDKAPQSSPPVMGVTVPGNLTPDQLEALRNTIAAMNPGAKVQVEIDHKDGGTVHTYEEGTGKGASAKAEGDKLSDKITGDAPIVNRGADGSASAKGGDIERNTSATALKVPPLPWQNPLFWIGLAALGGCGFCVYAGLRRAALICGIAGAGCLATAFYPAILLYAVAGILLVVFGPYLYAEFKKKKAEKDDEESYEALRAVVAGVEHRTLPAAMKQTIYANVPQGVTFTTDQMEKFVTALQRNVKETIAKEADGKDKEVIDAVKQEDKIGKYAD